MTLLDSLNISTKDILSHNIFIEDSDKFCNVNSKELSNIVQSILMSESWNVFIEGSIENDFPSTSTFDNPKEKIVW